MTTHFADLTPVGHRWPDLSIDEVYEIPRQLPAKAWEVLCLMVEGDHGGRSSHLKLQVLEDGSVRAHGMTMAALKKRGLVRRRPGGLWVPTSRGESLVDGQLFS